MITLHTNQGDIVLELDFAKAPKSAANFLQYAQDGQYEGTIFHRVIDNFMVQGGGYDTRYMEKTTLAPVRHEGREALEKGGPRNVVGTLAMARTNDPHSATAQFFINVTDNDFLNFKSPSASNWGYAVFGKVVAGTDIVDKLEKVKTGKRGFHGDVPVDPIVIEKAVAL